MAIEIFAPRCECGGFMEYNGNSTSSDYTTTYPMTMHEHVCDTCGEKKLYTRIRYKDKQ